MSTTPSDLPDNFRFCTTSSTHLHNLQSPHSPPFTRLFPEVVSAIVLCAVDDDLGPPTVVSSMSLVSRNVGIDNYFLGQVFPLKFDSMAPRRRLGHIASSAFAHELKGRFETLKRIRSGQPSPHTLHDLWTAYVMMLENDGQNERQLTDWARLPDFLRKVACDPVLQPVAVWLIWLTSYAEELLRETPSERQTILDLLHPLILQGLRPPTSAVPKYSCYDICYFGRQLSLKLPNVAHAAFLAYTARLEIGRPRTSFEGLPIPATRRIADDQGRRGATLEDYDEFDLHGRTALPRRALPNRSPSRPVESELNDTDWCRLLADPLPKLGHAYRPGQIQGLWSGKFMVPDRRAYAAGTDSSSVTFWTRPLYFRLREHYGGAPLSEFPPASTQWTESLDKEQLAIFNARTNERSRYETWRPGSHANGTIVLVTGETDERHGQAWGHYTFTGHIRLSDGWITLCRKPVHVEVGLGTWQFEGYIVSSCNFVGRWHGIDQNEGMFATTKMSE